MALDSFSFYDDSLEMVVCLSLISHIRSAVSEIPTSHLNHLLPRSEAQSMVVSCVKALRCLHAIC